PYLEHYYRNRTSEYLAHGLELEWRHFLNRQWQLATSLDAKRYEYTSNGETVGTDYKRYQWDANATYQPRANTSLSGGVTLSRRAHEQAAGSSRSAAVAAGLYDALPGAAGLFVSALASDRDSRNDASDFYLGDRRH